MAATDDAQAIMEGLAQKTLTSLVMLEKAKLYINYRDAMALTNEEIAQMFVDQMFIRAKQQLKAAAANLANEENMATVQAASDAAVVGL